MTASRTHENSPLDDGRQANEAINGFGNRFLIIAARRTHLIPTAAAPDRVVANASANLALAVKRARRFGFLWTSSVHGPLGFSVSGHAALADRELAVGLGALKVLPAVDEYSACCGTAVGLDSEIDDISDLHVE